MPKVTPGSKHSATTSFSGSECKAVHGGGVFLEFVTIAGILVSNGKEQRKLLFLTMGKGHQLIKEMSGAILPTFR